MGGIAIESVSKVFSGSGGTTAVFERFSLLLEEAKITTLLGPSSCGKTTLLNLIARLEPPSAGSIKLAMERSARVGYAMQQAPLLPWRTLAENAMLGTEIVGGARETKRREIDEYF
ncbi:MAG TPA: ATP-binding cassette domain-containing protein, partial [Candidatus Obscuribacterales bacterium]